MAHSRDQVPAREARMQRMTRFSLATVFVFCSALLLSAVRAEEPAADPFLWLEEIKGATHTAVIGGSMPGTAGIAASTPT